MQHDGDTAENVTEPEAERAATIDIASVVDDELMAAFERLIPQLSSSSPAPSRELLTRLVDGDDTDVFLARVDGQIVGCLTLAFYLIPTGLKAWIEDVVVDGAARGHGVGHLLSVAAVDEARRRGAKNVSLTSRPARDVANRLYQRIGFVARDTNVYRYSL